MKKLVISLGAVFMTFALALWSSAQSADFKVIVHTSNPAASLSNKDVSNYLLKKVTRWKVDGFKQAVAPIDLDTKSPTREAFSKQIHGRSTSSIKSYWNRQIFSGSEVPPPEAASDTEVISHVSANPGAIGYVSSGAQLGSGVKVVSLAN